jgi:hypothetical protein
MRLKYESASEPLHTHLKLLFSPSSIERNLCVGEQCISPRIWRSDAQTPTPFLAEQLAGVTSYLAVQSLTSPRIYQRNGRAGPGNAGPLQQLPPAHGIHRSLSSLGTTLKPKTRNTPETRNTKPENQNLKPDLFFHSVLLKRTYISFWSPGVPRACETLIPYDYHRALGLGLL